MPAVRVGPRGHPDPGPGSKGLQLRDTKEEVVSLPGPGAVDVGTVSLSRPFPHHGQDHRPPALTGRPVIPRENEARHGLGSGPRDPRP